MRVEEGVTGEHDREDGEDQRRLLRASRATLRNLHFMLKVVESQQRELPDSSGLVWLLLQVSMFALEAVAMACVREDGLNI